MTFREPLARRALVLAYRSTDSVDALSLDHPSVRGFRPALVLPDPGCPVPGRHPARPFSAGSHLGGQLKAAFTFIAHQGFHAQMLACMLDSLVRVTRRVDSYHFVSITSDASAQTPEPVARFPASSPLDSGRATRQGTGGRAVVARAVLASDSSVRRARIKRRALRGHGKDARRPF